ncbi:MAG: putative hydrolase YdeN [candidate division WS6 bacterium OLB20]|uniref:Putative hydrolase YdeN n=1 Tax=candidate division WS6 bacterium OLB20 TaxID=1617426 RepID=A0A136M0B4_9BACT|nr:MAG: putative hydrolase YdeN [candidate division WS6 bacterium OLB20]
MNVLILHGTDSNANSNWFQWLAEQLRVSGWNVFVPDLPQAERPAPLRYNPFLDQQLPFTLDGQAVLIGHSSGAVAALQYLQHVRPAEPVHAVWLVSGFVTDLGWEALTELFNPPLDYHLLQTLSEEYRLLHSKDDPYVPLGEAKTLAAKLDGNLLLKEHEGHFSLGTNPSYSEFPELLDLLQS